ncbi:MAG: prolipoprotein diacylglyceryl transferase [Candidatus Omnitrophota bacterium]|nr:prolipoprotein diacylglyceryl transferase [Candidatus Omnitrophota bacterium]
MHPIICKIGLFTVYSYGLALVLAFALCVELASARAKKENIPAAIISNFSFLVFVFGIIGARLFYIIENLGYYVKNPLEIIMLMHGGLSWFGGLFLGVLTGVVYLKKKKRAVYEIFDLLVPFLALAQGIGRIGCLLNGCCFGKIPGIPIQIYSSLALILIFIILRFLQDRPHKAGQIFFSYLLLYSAKRFIIEFWRLEHAPVFLGLTLFQVISIALFCFALFKIIKSFSTALSSRASEASRGI